MSGSGTTARSAESRFWARFTERARRAGVKEPGLRWHMRRAEDYLKAFPDKRLAQHTNDDVTAYLEQAGRLGRIADWQFVQMVDAVENLLRTARAPVADAVDWGFWRDSARSLAADHPTIAREAGPAQAAAGAEPPVSGARFKEKRNAASALDGARDAHRALLDRMVAEIRRRKYSIRTEQAYESWVCRFILFCGNADPAAVGVDRLRAFLEDLAVRGNVSASTQSQALNALVFLY